MTELLAISVFVAAYILIVVDRIDRVIVALGGAIVLLGLRVVDVSDAFHSERYGVDWGVLLLLLGMMAIVGTLAQTGLFGYLGVTAAQRAEGRPFPILVTLVVITAAASALLDNVATVLLLLPVTISVTTRLGLPPAPFLIAEALASNIGGTATLVGDPPNIIIASEAGLGYDDFLLHLAPLVVVLMLAFVGLCRLLFRTALRYDADRVAEVMRLDARAEITDGPLLVRALSVLGLVTVAFVTHTVLHLEPAVVALVGAGALLLLARRDPKLALEHVEWPTLAFFTGLFIMVGALVKTGTVERLATALADATGGHVLGAAMVLVWASAVLSAVVDNIPYVATMAPVVGTLVEDVAPGANGRALWWALALGADLGGNATIIGASANVVVAGAAAAAGHPITFLEFARYGIPTTVVTVAIAAVYLWLRYAALGLPA